MTTIPLWPAPVAGDFQPCLTPYLLPENEAAPAIIICPGGGYWVRVDHEKGNVAKRFNELGFNCFVLEYRLPCNAIYPAPQLDALRAIKLLRSRAAEFRIKENAVAIMGFSAGGHLASTTAHLWDKLDASSAAVTGVADTADSFSARPDATVLAYALISGVLRTHPGVYENLFGVAAPTREQLESVSAELQVNERTPPSFIWHTADDEIVPVENALNYAAALTRFKIPHALHIFPFGAHGKTIATDDPVVSKWTDLCAGFLRQLGF